MIYRGSGPLKKRPIYVQYVTNTVSMYSRHLSHAKESIYCLATSHKQRRGYLYVKCMWLTGYSYQIQF
jgi:hypothetical protein